MKPILKFETVAMRVSTLGNESSVPDLRGMTDPQKDLNYCFQDEDEIYAGYGHVGSAYPYRLYDCVESRLKERDMKTAVLENEYLRAVFLPELGGRLWSLTDKESGRNLLYTNDVIKLRNLAIRNAWFSGGVEWNIGIIGHTPFTADPLFTARLTDENDNPVLRMYEYERIRQVEYQMDFWLEEQERFLNCRMRIVNSGTETVPMYWWSNMAVPEYEGGRVIVPARQAFSGGRKVDIPRVDGIDMSYYKDIPKQVDYFFNIPGSAPKYIANVDDSGYGLFQISTDRLKGRKLFSWGNNDGSAQWQGFLTERAGNYLELQAGLGKTQAGCIPMPPHTTWEWLEQYSAIQLKPGENRLPFEELQELATAYARGKLRERKPEETLERSKGVATSRGKLVYCGSGYGAFKNYCRAMEQGASLSEHLDYGNMEKKQRLWAEFLKTGILHQPPVDEIPEDLICERQVYGKLMDTLDGANRDNWYAYYQVGLYNYWKGNLQQAAQYFERSLSRQESPWAYHALASCCLQDKECRTAVSYMVKGINLRKNDLAYMKDAFRILLEAEGYRELLDAYAGLADEIKEESRIRFGYLLALYHVGDAEKAYDFLREHEDYTLDDLRECDTALEELWVALETCLFGECREIPERYRFASV